MTLKYLKPLIGIHVDEPLDFQNLTDNQEERIGLAAEAWQQASGAAVFLSLALTGAVDPDLDDFSDRHAPSHSISRPLHVNDLTPYKP